MIRFIKINNLYDIDNLYNLFISKKLINKGRVSIGEKYITVNQNKKTYMILIEDSDKRNIANCIYSKEWFEDNILETVKKIVTNMDDRFIK